MFSFFKRKKKLDGDGERVDINYYKIRYENFDMYQKSHYHRYKFAQNYIKNTDVVGDFACGSGYGTMMLAEKAKQVIGVDFNEEVVYYISERYAKQQKASFVANNLLNIDYEDVFDVIVSFETVEHLTEDNIVKLFDKYNKALKKGGRIIFSTPYNQEESEAAIKMGFHLTFYIVEETIYKWMENAGFEIESVKYQSYEEHEVCDSLEKKVFIICTGKKR